MPGAAGGCLQGNPGKARMSLAGPMRALLPPLLLNTIQNLRAIHAQRAVVVEYQAVEAENAAGRRRVEVEHPRRRVGINLNHAWVGKKIGLAGLRCQGSQSIVR